MGTPVDVLIAVPDGKGLAEEIASVVVASGRAVCVFTASVEMAINVSAAEV
jgi:hypothetical protein